MTYAPLKVLYLNTSAKPGGAEFALLRLLSGLDRRKVEPIVLFGEDGKAVDLVRATGVETHVLPLTSKVREVRKDTLAASALLHPGRLMLTIAYAGRLAAFARRRGIDLIHTNTIKAHIYGAVAGRLVGRPVVWHLRDYVDESYLPHAAVRAMRWMARCAPRHVIAVSQSVMDQLRLAPGDQRSTVVRDGLTEDELRRFAGRPARQKWNEPVRIGIVGRLTAWKGQHVFIDAASRVLQKGFAARFLIVGSALFGEKDYEARLRRQVEELGVEGDVELLGFRNDVPRVLRSLDILVHASTSADPCPNTVLEGMAEGLPVIGSDGGGVPEMLTHRETGLLTPMGDSESLATALEALLNDPGTASRLGLAAAGRVRRDFTSTRVARQVEGVYDAVMRGRVAPTSHACSGTVLNNPRKAAG